MTFTDQLVEGEGHKTIGFQVLPIYTHIPNVKALIKIFFELSHLKGKKIRVARGRALDLRMCDGPLYMKCPNVYAKKKNGRTRSCFGFTQVGQSL